MGGSRSSSTCTNARRARRQGTAAVRRWAGSRPVWPNNPRMRVFEKVLVNWTANVCSFRDAGAPFSRCHTLYLRICIRAIADGVRRGMLSHALVGFLTGIFSESRTRTLFRPPPDARTHFPARTSRPRPRLCARPQHPKRTAPRDPRAVSCAGPGAPGRARLRSGPAVASRQRVCAPRRVLRVVHVAQLAAGARSDPWRRPRCVSNSSAARSGNSRVRRL